MAFSFDATALQEWVRSYAAAIDKAADQLTELDSAIGDADHGSNMRRGMTAVVAALDEKQPATPKAVLTTVASTLISKVGGASGPLYGTLFLRMGSSAGDADTLDAHRFAAALHAGLDGVVARGKAEKDDKTMYDALAPAVETLETEISSGQDLSKALTAAATAAAAGRDATTALQARKGRASYLGERSIGHQDPGATSLALLIETAAQTAQDST